MADLTPDRRSDKFAPYMDFKGSATGGESKLGQAELAQSRGTTGEVDLPTTDLGAAAADINEDPATPAQGLDATLPAAQLAEQQDDEAAIPSVPIEVDGEQDPVATSALTQEVVAPLTAAALARSNLQEAHPAFSEAWTECHET